MEFVEAIKKSREFSGTSEDFDRAIRLMEVDAFRKKAEAEEQKAKSRDEFVKLIMKTVSEGGYFKIMIKKL